MELVLLCLKVLLGRIFDVTLATMNTIFIVKGQRIKAMIFGFIDVFIWFVVVKEALNTNLTSIWIAICYALGYGLGTLIGGVLSKFFVKGTVNVQVITKNIDYAVTNRLKETDYAASIIECRGLHDDKINYIFGNMNENLHLKSPLKPVFETKEDMFDNDPSTNFTALANKEFESLFNALDRNNEAQFRLLFTPIAQQSMIDLLRSKEPFGDDFVFLKRNNLNYIKSAHSQTTLYLEDFARYNTYDYEVAKATFIQDAEDYFKGIYFDLAPLMCIPLYQQHMSQEYIYEDQYYGNVTSYETEAIANRYNEKVFAPKDAVTHCILKSEFRKKKGKGDKVNIHAYAYRAENRTTIITKMGADGRNHQIPVHWIEYIPVEKVTPFVVQPVSSEERYDQIIDKLTSDENLVSNILTGGIYYRRGILSMLLNDEDNYDPDYIDKLLS